MMKEKTKKKLKEPWGNLQGLVWMVGLIILAWKGWWWPGILVLAAISMFLEIFLGVVAPQAFEEVEDETANPVEMLEQAPTAVPPVIAPQQAEPRFGRLPPSCPKCGGPIRGHEIQWTSATSADCPYCGGNLPMSNL
jgi:hypothetical protein